MTSGDDQTPEARPHAFSPEEAEVILREAARAYFDGCRARVRPFVDRHFSLAGTLRLHRAALGLDIVRAPANALLAIPQVGLKLGGLAARGLGKPRTAEALEKRNLILETAVMREVRWRIVTELLQQPAQEGDRVSRRDGLAEALLTHPRIAGLMSDAAEAVGAQAESPEFRARLEATLTEYTATRAAASDIATALVALGTGAAAFNKATPGAIALGPLVAGALAQQAAIASFPLGAGAGAIWYGLFPAASSPLLVAGATAGLLGIGAVAASFAGVLTDPALRLTGVHRRRLHKLIDGLEAGFTDRDAAGFRTYDLYLARVMDLSDALLGVLRALR